MSASKKPEVSTCWEKKYDSFLKADMSGLDIKNLLQRLIKGKKLLIICGPTCVGKSALAFELAHIFHTDIISADSMQAYKGMDIGTDKYAAAGKPVRQYMVDIVEPDHDLTAVEFRDMAREIIEKKFFRLKKVPILVGGSGLHIRCIIDDLAEAPEVEPELRKRIRKEGQDKGLFFLYKKLLECDQAYAQKISSHDEKRIIRALEVFEATGKPFSSFQKNWDKRESVYDVVFLGITAHREKIYRDIEKRVDQMFQKGLIEEVRLLQEKGFDKNHSFQQAIGYKEVLEYLNHQITLAECQEKIKKNTRKLVKKQITWFKADGRIKWINASDFDTMSALTRQALWAIGEIISNEDVPFFQTERPGK